MNFIINWLLSAAILYGLSEYTTLLSLESFVVALKLSALVCFIAFILRIVSGFLKVLGCLTLGISYIAALLIQLLAIPFALLKVQPYLSGYSIPGQTEAMIVGIILTVFSGIILDRKKSSQ